MPPKKIFIILLFVSIIASACNFPFPKDKTLQAPTPRPGSSGDVFPIDPVFDEFYNFLGGRQRLGPAISPLIESGNLKTQYIESGLMVYDPLAPSSDRFRLESLGVMMGISEPPVENPEEEGTRYLNGHIIYREFVQLYEELGGARYVGRPLTEAHHNPDKRRIEQYFENLGFYRMIDEPPGTIHLLAYGAYICDFRCRYQPPSSSILSLRGFLPEPFSSTAIRLGLNFTGLTLSEPRVSRDGKIEVIFENIVLVIGLEPRQTGPDLRLPFNIWLPAILFHGSFPGGTESTRITPQYWLPLVFDFSPHDEEKVLETVLSSLWIPVIFKNFTPAIPELTLRPIARVVGMQVLPPGPELEDPLMEFIAVSGELGYNVPALFISYLEPYGGIELSGPPISEPYAIGEGVFRQCFENLCVDFDTKVEGVQSLSLAPLGIIYEDLFYPESGESSSLEETGIIEIELAESANYVASGEVMEIRVKVTERGAPLQNREPFVLLTYPDGKQQMFKLDPTDRDGNTLLTLPPINAPNATLIPYEVCLAETNEDLLCVKDNYLIWNFPE